MIFLRTAPVSFVLLVWANLSQGSLIRRNENGMQKTLQAKDIKGHVADNLNPQMGPSCWITVIEAILAERGKSCTDHCLSLYIAAYPTDGKLDAYRLANKIPLSKFKKRKCAATIIKTAFETIDTKLETYATRGANGAETETITHEKFVDLLRRSDSLAYPQIFGQRYISLFDGTDPLTIATVRGHFATATSFAGKMGELDQSDDDDIVYLLGGQVGIFPEQEDADVIATLQQAVKLPAFATILKKFDYKKTEGPFEDYTEEDISNLKNTRHAIMVETIDPSKRIITYKDPNYGDKPQLKVTLDQFKLMTKRLLYVGDNPAKIVTMCNHP